MNKDQRDQFEESLEILNHDCQTCTFTYDGIEFTSIFFDNDDSVVFRDLQGNEHRINKKIEDFKNDCSGNRIVLTLLFTDGSVAKIERIK